MNNKRWCLYCGNTKADHTKPWNRCSYFVASPGPTCRVCGSGFDPAKSGRDDCCYRHRMDA